MSDENETTQPPTYDELVATVKVLEQIATKALAMVVDMKASIEGVPVDGLRQEIEGYELQQTIAALAEQPEAIRNAAEIHAPRLHQKASDFLGKMTKMRAARSQKEIEEGRTAARFATQWEIQGRIHTLEQIAFISMIGFGNAVVADASAQNVRPDVAIDTFEREIAQVLLTSYEQIAPHIANIGATYGHNIISSAASALRSKYPAPTDPEQSRPKPFLHVVADNTKELGAKSDGERRQD